MDKKKAPRACSTCKKRKTKCDRVIPSCGACEKNDRTCYYDPNTKLRTCLPCAKLKAKCSRDLPKCARCVARNVVCEYPYATGGYNSASTQEIKPSTKHLNTSINLKHEEDDVKVSLNKKAKTLNDVMDVKQQQAGQKSAGDEVARTMGPAPENLERYAALWAQQNGFDLEALHQLMKQNRAAGVDQRGSSQRLNQSQLNSRGSQCPTQNSTGKQVPQNQPSEAQTLNLAAGLPTNVCEHHHPPVQGLLQPSLLLCNMPGGLASVSPKFFTWPSGSSPVLMDQIGPSVGPPIAQQYVVPINTGSSLAYATQAYPLHGNIIGHTNSNNTSETTQQKMQSNTTIKSEETSPPTCNTDQLPRFDSDAPKLPTPRSMRAAQALNIVKEETTIEHSLVDRFFKDNSKRKFATIGNQVSVEVQDNQHVLSSQELPLTSNHFLQLILLKDEAKASEVKESNIGLEGSEKNDSCFELKEKSKLAVKPTAPKETPRPTSTFNFAVADEQDNAGTIAINSPAGGVYLTCFCKKGEAEEVQSSTDGLLHCSSSPRHSEREGENLTKKGCPPEEKEVVVKQKTDDDRCLALASPSVNRLHSGFLVGTKCSLFLSSFVKRFSICCKFLVDTPGIQKALSHHDMDPKAFKSQSMSLTRKLAQKDIIDRANHAALLAAIGLGCIQAWILEESTFKEISTLISVTLQPCKNEPIPELLFAHGICGLYALITNNLSQFMQHYSALNRIQFEKCSSLMISQAMAVKGYITMWPLLNNKPVEVDNYILKHVEIYANQFCCIEKDFPKIYQFAKERGCAPSTLCSVEEQLIQGFASISLFHTLQVISLPTVRWSREILMCDPNVSDDVRIQVLEEVVRFIGAAAQFYNCKDTNFPPAVKCYMLSIQSFLMILAGKPDAKLVLKQQVDLYCEDPLLLIFGMTSSMVHQIHFLCMALSKLEMSDVYNAIQSKYNKLANFLRQDNLPRHPPLSSHGLCDEDKCMSVWNTLVNPSVHTYVEKIDFSDDFWGLL